MLQCTGYKVRVIKSTSTVLFQGCEEKEVDMPKDSQEVLPEIPPTKEIPPTIPIPNAHGASGLEATTKVAPEVLCLNQKLLKTIPSRLLFPWPSSHKPTSSLCRGSCRWGADHASSERWDGWLEDRVTGMMDR